MYELSMGEKIFKEGVFVMAKSTIKFSCGCGFITDNPLEAAVHADTAGHKVDAHGLVVPDKPVLKKRTGR